MEYSTIWAQTRDHSLAAVIDEFLDWRSSGPEGLFVVDTRTGFADSSALGRSRNIARSGLIFENMGGRDAKQPLRVQWYRGPCLTRIRVTLHSVR